MRYRPNLSNGSKSLYGLVFANMEDANSYLAGIGGIQKSQRRGQVFKNGKGLLFQRPEDLQHVLKWAERTRTRCEVMEYTAS